MPLNALQIRQMQRTADAQGFVFLLQLNHAGWAQPIRLNSDSRNWSFSDVTFFASGFSFMPAEDSAESTGASRITIPNVGREIVAELEALSSGQLIEATLRVVLRPTTGTAIDPTTMFMESVADAANVSINTSVVTLTVNNQSRAARSVSVFRYDPQTAPGLFTS